MRRRITRQMITGKTDNNCSNVTRIGSTLRAVRKKMKTVGRTEVQKRVEIEEYCYLQFKQGVVTSVNWNDWPILPLNMDDVYLIIHYI